MGIDENLYSRQIGTLGFDTMTKLMGMRVLIIGMRGIGIETAKNLVLAGPQEVLIFDSDEVLPEDLGCNFYLQEKHIGNQRGFVCAPLLAELNHYVKVSAVFPQDFKELLAIVKGVSVVVATDCSRRFISSMDEFCRSSSIGFIAGNSFGLVGRIFVDFGLQFTVHDINGTEAKTSFISGISNGNPGILSVDSRSVFEMGDTVTLSEIKGMVELNGTIIKVGKCVDPYSFEIIDTSFFGQYTEQGIVTEIKTPSLFQFKSFEEADSEELPIIMCDLGKFGRSELLHLYIKSMELLLEESYERKIKIKDVSVIGLREHFSCFRARDETFVETVHKNASKECERRSITQDTNLDTVVRPLVYFGHIEFPPLVSFLGGVIAQEIIKYTGKYTPIQQFLYMDMFEVISHNPKYYLRPLISMNDNDNAMSDFVTNDSCSNHFPMRYKHLITIFGSRHVSLLQESVVFLVGVGAIGCEFLKIFALLGIGDDRMHYVEQKALDGEMTDSEDSQFGKGKVIITDMDRIEMSNLNRQFLFRPIHVGSSKSLIGSEISTKMNDKMKVIPMEEKLGEETQNIFDENFWLNLDVVVNALDNVPTRQYVDTMCVQNHIPLLDSGTLGTRASTQVVYPHLTECYSDARDPPEKSIPLCTLKHFPYMIDHTIQWARDLFEGFFIDNVKQLQKLASSGKENLDDGNTEIAEGINNTNLEWIIALSNTWKVLSTETNKMEDIVYRLVKLSILTFDQHFNYSPASLLFNFPSDSMKSDGTPFWSGHKRVPTVINFTVNDNLHVSYILEAFMLFSVVFNAKVESVLKDDIIKIASQFDSRELNFKLRKQNIRTDEKDSSPESVEDADLLLKSQIISLARDLHDSNLRPLSFIEFEKDDDTNHHVDFVHCVANLRARNYAIKETERYNVKMIAGKIIPAIATTTAMAVGLSACEFFKVVLARIEDLKIEHLRNSFVDLAISQWVLSEPGEPKKNCSVEYDIISGGPVRALPENWTCWDSIMIEIHDATLSELITHLEREYNMKVYLLTCGNYCIYNDFGSSGKQRLHLKLKELYRSIVSNGSEKIPSHLRFNVSASSNEDGEDLLMPPIVLKISE